MFDIGHIKIAAFLKCGISRWGQEMWRGAVVVRGPLVEMVRDVVCRWVGPRIFKIDNDNLVEEE